MSQTLVIAGRELAEKRFVFYAAIAFAVVSVLVPFVPGVSHIHSNPRDVIAVGSLLLSIGFTLGLSALLGANVVGRDITAGRMSFFFTRPVSAPAIWLGKLLSALVLIAASFFIILAPLLLVGVRVTRIWNLDTVQLLTIVGTFALIVFAATHAIGTMLRSRSGWIALDFAAACAAASLVWLIDRPLFEAAAWAAQGFLFRSMIFGGVASVLIAGTWQLIDGRSDRRRSHAAFSKALWIGIAVVLLLAAATVTWIVSVRVSDIVPNAVTIVEQARGDWAIVGGEVPHRFDYHAAFLVNARTGAAERLREPYWQVQFSGNGNKLVALTRANAPAGRARLLVRDVATGRETDTHLLPALWRAAVAMTDDGSRLAVGNGGTVTVYDVNADRSLMSVRLSEPQTMFFVRPDLVRAYLVSSSQPRVLSVYEIDLALHMLRKTGETTVNTNWILMSANADASRLAISGGRGIAPQVLDGRTLQPVGGVDLTGMAFPHYLADGRLVARAPGQPGQHGAAMAVIGSDGVTKTIDLGPGSAPFFVREVAPGKVLMRVAAASGSGDKWTSVVVDADRGTVLRRESGLVAADVFNPPDARAFVGGSDVLLVAKSGISRWNALSGEKKPL